MPPGPGFDPAATRETVNRWILTEAAKAASEVTAALEAYRFNDASDAAYRFVWAFLLRLVPGAHQAGPAGGQRRSEGRDARDRRLHARHHPAPAASFHALHHRGAVARSRRGRTRTRCWRSPAGRRRSSPTPTPHAEINWLVELVSAIRSVRSEMNVPTAAKTQLVAMSQRRRRSRRALSVTGRRSSGWRASTTSRPTARRAAPCRADHRRRRHLRAAARRHHRFRRRRSAAGKRDRPRGRRDHPHRQEARQRELHQPRAGGCGAGRARETRPLTKKMVNAWRRRWSG